MKPGLRIFFRILEFTLLFFGIPLFLYFDSSLIHPSAILLPILLGLILYFSFNKNFKFRELICLSIPRNYVLKNLFIVILIGFVLLAIVWLFERENLFNLPRRNTYIWLILCIFYPVFSAYIQEVIYRTFLFHRYKTIFKNKWLLILASGITFSFVHIVYYSPLSLILTLAGGLYLAYLYEKTKSVLFTAIIHGIFGIMIFTFGLGQHFWLDMYKWL